MTIKKWHAAVAVIMLAIAGWVVVDLATDSCEEWRERYREALIRSIQWHPAVSKRNERYAVAVIESERPVGCR